MSVTQAGGERVRMRVDVLDRHDGVYIVRLKPFSAPENVEVSVKYNEEHVADSPYKIKGKQERFCIQCWKYPHQCTLPSQM